MVSFFQHGYWFLRMRSLCSFNWEKIIKCYKTLLLWIWDYPHVPFYSIAWQFATEWSESRVSPPHNHIIIINLSNTAFSAQTLSEFFSLSCIVLFEQSVLLPRGEPCVVDRTLYFKYMYINSCKEKCCMYDYTLKFL